MILIFTPYIAEEDSAFGLFRFWPAYIGSLHACGSGSTRADRLAKQMAESVHRSRLCRALLLAQAAIIVWLAWTFRVELYEKVAARVQCRILFIGDSLTSEGGVWAWKLGRWWPDTRNVGRAGADLYFVKSVADENLPVLRPECVVVMAGINDFGRGHDVVNIIRDYEATIAVIRQTKSVKSMVIVSTLYLRDGKQTPEIDQLNEALRALCDREKLTFVDLRPVLCKDGRLLPEFSRDIVHLNDEGRRRWAEALKPVLETLGL